MRTPGGRLEALRERNYRFLFAATLTTALGDSIGLIALAFAVLAVADATALGIVLAARQAVSALVLVFGGVVSDRSRRNVVLAGASFVQCAAQAALAVAVLTDGATVALFVAFGVLWGIGDGLVVPAEAGLVPQTVSPARLHQANALQGLSRSGVRVAGPAIGGILVVAASPGWGLAVDSLTYLACAVFLLRIRTLAPPPEQRSAFLADLRVGWREFAARTWLWSTVALFGLGNAFYGFLQVLGPAVAKDRLGGAGAWAAILTATGIGAIAGGVAALRYRPDRSLSASIAWSMCVLPEFVAFAAGAPTSVIAACASIAGFGIAVHVALWFTTFQTHVPRHVQSRVASYDAFGSVALYPAGAAVAGPLAEGIGAPAAFWIAAATLLVTSLMMLSMRAVRAIR